MGEGRGKGHGDRDDYETGPTVPGMNIVLSFVVMAATVICLYACCHRQTMEWP